MASSFYSLPDLPFPKNALVPCISEQFMELHFHKQHQTYVNKLNATVKAYSKALATNDLVTQLELQAAIRSDASGHINHALFWKSLTPIASASSPQPGDPRLYQAILKRWQDFETFKKAFEAAALSLQGSSWEGLTKDSDSDQLDIATTKDQDIFPKGKNPLLGVDMWEHACYLRYMNNKKEYVTGIQNVVNWQTITAKFIGVPRETFGNLSGLNSRI